MKLYKLCLLQFNSYVTKEGRGFLLSFVYFFAISLFITSCNNFKENKEGKWNVVDSVTFNIGFQPSAAIQYIEFNNNEYIGFSNLRTSKMISVFNIQGNLHYSVSIDSLMIRENNYFISFCFVNLDSLALLSSYTNKVVIIDTNGNTLYKKDYSYLLTKDIELSSPISLKKNKLRLAIHFLDNNFPQNPALKDYESYNQKNHSFHNLLYDTSFYQKANPIFQLDSIYNRFSNKKQMTTEGIHILTEVPPLHHVFMAVHTL